MPRAVASLSNIAEANFTPARGESRKGYFHGLARREAVPARFYFSSTNRGRTFLRRLNATVSCPRIYESSVGARQLVRQDGGRAANFRARNRCNLPRRAHQLASARDFAGQKIKESLA